MDAVGDDQELVRRQNLSTLVGPLVEASIPPTIYNDPTYQIEIKKVNVILVNFSLISTRPVDLR